MSIQRPKLNSSGLNDSDHKSLVSELTKYAEEGASDADLKEFRNTFITQKKKGTPLPESTAPPQKLDSETPTGSSVGVKPNAVAKAPIKVVENATQKEQRLRKELSNVKVTSANMDAVSSKTDELSALQKANSKAAKQKLDATDNNIISKIFSTNKQGLDAAFKSEEDDNEVSDYLREGGKKLLNVVGGIVNTVPRGINKFSSNSGFPLNIPTADKFEPKIPFGTQLKEVDAETAERKKQDPNYFVNDVDRMALAKEKFGVQAVKQQHLENAAELLNDQDPEVQIRIKSKIINSIKGTTATSKAISAQIQVLDNQATPLSNEISEMEKTIKGGKYTDQFATDYEAKKASFNAISEQYKGLLDDASKNDNENLTAQERLEVFKLDYNPFVKAADDIVGGFSKLGGDALYAMGKLSQKINEIPGVANINEKLSIGGAGTEDPSNIFLQGAEVLLKDAENRQNAHPHIKVTDIKGFGDLGGWAGQTLGAIAPFAIGMAIGSTEASLASKAFLPMSPGLMGFSLGAAGGAMSDMDKEMENTPGLDYSNWQYMAKTAGSVGSNALMFGNYAAIFKGNKALFESIGKTPAATVEFKKGFQDYAGDLFNVAKGSNKTGATMALVSGINMFVDNHILGKKHEGSFEEIADSYVEGVAMHIGTAEAPKALVFMAEKLLPSPTKKAIRSNLGTIHTLMKEVNNPNLTPQERAIVTKKVFETHKENTVLLSKSLKDAGNLTGKQINELLIADQNRFDITKKVEEVKKGNFSDEYKKSELNKLKAEFKALDSRTTNVFSDPFNAINILPDAAKRKTEAKAELIKEFNDKNPESNKKIVLEDNEINERALKNYSKELKDDKAAKLELEKEQAPIVETPVAETPKAEEVVIPESLKDVDSTTKALNEHLVPTKESGLWEDGKQIKDLYKLVKNTTFKEIKKGLKNKGGYFSSREIISEAYHKAKADGSNPELVKAVEKLLGEQSVTPEVVAENVEGQGVSKEVVAPKIAEDISKKSVEDLEKRQAEIEGDKSNSKEFNEIDKELEKREWQSVMLAPLHEVEAVLDALVEKEKTMPNGFGSFIEKRDIRESKAITKKYQGEVSKEDAGKDFKDAFFGNPSSWYADGLKLKESVRAFMEQGGTFKELLQSVQKEFEYDGFTEKEAASVINKKLSEVAKANESTPETNTPTNPQVEGVSKEVVAPSVEDNSFKKVDEYSQQLIDIIDTDPSLEKFDKYKKELKEKYNIDYVEPNIRYENENNIIESFTGLTNKTTNKGIPITLDVEKTKGINRSATVFIYDKNGESIGKVGLNIDNGNLRIGGAEIKESERRKGVYSEVYSHIEDFAKKNDLKIIDSGKSESAKEFHKNRNEKLQKPNTPTNGDVQPGVQPVGESGVAKPETPAKESVPSPVDGGKSKGDVEVSDLDHAKDQIEKGVLQWNGDTGAERVKLGISWADIRKGEADIKRGKENTVPAKRLIEALKTAKEKGGYEYTQGKGGITNEQFVSLEDIQKANNEYQLTDAEQKEVATREVELAKKYESDFEGLDLQTKIDIYENRENREGNDGLGEKPTTSGESKNDVSKGKEGEGAKPTTKEKVNEPELQQKIDDFDFEKFVEDAKNEKPLTEAEIQAEKDIENEDFYQKSSFDKKWAKTYKEAKEKLIGQIKEAEAVIAKWEAKVYKKSDGSVYVGSELDGQNVSFNRINENRKQKNIENAKGDIKQAKKDLKTLGISETEITKPTETPSKPTTKERVAERVKLSDSKIDAKSEIVKAKLKAFTDMFPSADINPADYKQNGYSMDAVIDMVAKAAKSIAKGGIVTSEHINEAIKAWNEHFDDVIDVKEIEKITNPKEEPLFVDENGDSYTSLKNAVSNPEREAKGKEVVVVRDGKTDAERKQDLHDRMDSGEISKEEIQDITTALANGSVEELATRHSKADIITILLKDKVTLENRTTEIRQELEDNKGTEKEGQSLLDLARNEMLEDQNYLASATLKGEWSEMGRNLQDAMKADFSRPAIIKKLENASKNNELSPELRQKAGEMAEEIKQMQTKLDEHQAKYEELDAKYKDKETENDDLQEKISKHEGEKALEKAVKLQGLKTKKEYKIADIEKKQKVVIDRLREKYKNLSGMVNAGINPKFLELAPDIAILAKYEIQKGAVKLEEVIGRVHLQLVDIIPELTERDVRDLFSGYGKSVIPKEVSANEQTLRDLRAKARALSGLQDVKEEGTAPLRSGFRHTEPTEEVKALRREIHREMRARGIDMRNAKDPQAVWKTAIESYKTRTNNRIEYLESIAKSKDVEKYLREKKKTKMKLDDEARQLRVKSQKLKHVVDDMVSKADFEAWSKFRKTRHYGVRYTRGVLISAPTTLAKILGAAAWRTAYKIPTAVATYGASKLRPGIAKVEGINTVKDLTQHIVDYYKTEFSMTNLKESFKTLKNHASQEEILFGKHHGRIPLPKVIGNKSLNTAQKLFFGHLKFLEDISASSHGALKNLVALPEYEAYKNTIMRNLIREGIPEDMMNDGSMEQIAHQLAYAKSQRARFGQDNAVSSAKSEWMAKLKNKKHYMTADVIDIALPIVKIASNYIGESLEKYPVIGLAGNRKSLFKASDMLTSKEQGHLLRTLASQGVGAMSLVAGAMMYKNISAFYGTDADDQAKEQNPELAKHDGAIGAISHLLAHSPDAEMIRVGASFMWYWELYDKKNNADKSIMSDFMLATIKNTTSIMNQSPYFSTSESLLAPLLDSDFSFESLGKVGVNFIRPRVPFMDATNVVAQGKIPQLEKLYPELSGKISEKLGMTPETVKSYEVGLRPKGFVDNLKMGIPGWRNELLKKLMEESKMPKLKTPEAYVKRKGNEYNKIKNEVQFRKEHK
jgi:hypothetical protein